MHGFAGWLLMGAGSLPSRPPAPAPLELTWLASTSEAPAIGSPAPATTQPASTTPAATRVAPVDPLLPPPQAQEPVQTGPVTPPPGGMTSEDRPAAPSTPQDAAQVNNAAGLPSASQAPSTAPPGKGETGRAPGPDGLPAAPTPTLSIRAVSYLVPPELVYPLASRRAQEEGRAWVRLLVDASGAPQQVRLETSSGHPRLDEAALATATATRFRPHTENGTARAFWVLMPFVFELEN